uniref:Uncharacterized protein n=1 Tax=Molossus molossus TaxID=27622 RepID=A0A7J8J113_MOLMO|nr:hypothetical protein HJG59_010399 [Molossus molossus]
MRTKSITVRLHLGRAPCPTEEHMHSPPRKASGGSLGTPGQRPGLLVTPTGIFRWSQMSHQGHSGRNSLDLIQAPVNTPQQHRPARWRRTGFSPKIGDKPRMLLSPCHSLLHWRLACLTGNYPSVPR